MQVRVGVEMLAILVVFLLAAGGSEGLDKCILKKDLTTALPANILNHMKNELANIVCHAEMLTHFNTSKVTNVTISEKKHARAARSAPESSSEESNEEPPRRPKPGFSSATAEPTFSPRPQPSLDTNTINATDTPNGNASSFGLRHLRIARSVRKAPRRNSKDSSEVDTDSNDHNGTATSHHNSSSTPAHGHTGNKRHRRAIYELNVKAHWTSSEESKKESKEKPEEESDEESKEESDEDSKGKSDEDSKGESDEESKEESDEKSKGESDEESKGESDEESKGESDEESKGESDEESKEESDEESKDESDEESKGESDEESKGESDEESKGESDEESKGESDEESEESSEESDEESDEESMDPTKADNNSMSFTPNPGPHGNGSFPTGSHRFARSTQSSSEVEVWTLYGLFQLPGQIACTSGSEPSLNLCNMSCDNLLNQNITDDIACLGTIIKEVLHGKKQHAAEILEVYKTLKLKECANVVESKYFSGC